MAGAKQRGVITQHMARYHDGREIKPCRHIGKGRGRGIMVAQYKDTGDVVLNNLGQPIAWRSA